jgi:hypothetical protein
MLAINLMLVVIAFHLNVSIYLHASDDKFQIVNLIEHALFIGALSPII